MKKKMLLSGTILAATLMATDFVKANEVVTPVSGEQNAPATSEGTSSRVTLEEVNAAKNNVDSSQQSLDMATFSEYKGGIEVNKAVKAVDSAQKALADAEQSAATISKTDQELQEAKTTTQAELANAEESLGKAQQQAPSQSEVDTQKTLVNQKSESLNSKKTESEATAKEITDFNSKIGTNEKIVSDLEKKIADNEAQLKNGENQKPYYELNAEFKLSSEYIKALKEYEQLIYYAKGERLGQSAGYANNEAKKAEAKALAERLVKIGQELDKNIQYQAIDADKSDVVKDIYNLTEQQKLELNLFGIDLANKIRQQVVGAADYDRFKLTPTQGMFNFADEIAIAQNAKLKQVLDAFKATPGTDYAANVNAAKSKVGDAQFNILDQGTYDYALINGAARHNGLSSSTGKEPQSPRYQRQVDQSGKIQDITDGLVTNVDTNSITRGNDKIRHSESNPMTMADLKELVFNGFKRMMLIPGFGNSTNLSNRAFEAALRVSGILAEVSPNEKHIDPIGSIGYTFMPNFWAKNNDEFTFQLFFYQESGREQKETTDVYAEPGINPAIYNGTVLENGTPNSNNVDVATLKREIEQDKVRLNATQQQLVSDKQMKTDKELAQTRLEIEISALQTEVQAESEKLAQLNDQLRLKNEAVQAAQVKVNAAQAAVDQAQKELDQAKAVRENVEKAKQAVAASQAQLSQAQSVLANIQKIKSEAQVAYDNAKAEYERLLDLYKQQNPDKPAEPEVTVETRVVEITTNYEDDPSLPVGESRVKAVGKAGSVQLITTTIRNADGTTTTQTSEKVLEQMEPRVILRGTKVVTPSDKPSDKPTDKPSDKPTDKPSDKPTDKPSDKPTNKPSDKPTDKPSDKPTDKPSDKPSDKPTDKPSDKPLDKPTDKPSDKPSDKPTDKSSDKPSAKLMTMKQGQASSAKQLPNTGTSESALALIGAGTLVMLAGVRNRRKKN